MLLSLSPIATISSCFIDPFCIPRQAGLVPSSEAQIVFNKEFNDPDYIRELEHFSHLWVLWHCHRLKGERHSPVVRPPRAGGNSKFGVFATRSPYRPNPIALSVVELKKIVTSPLLTLHVANHDFLDGTPVLDIKPYIHSYDAREASSHPALDSEKLAVSCQAPSEQWSKLTASQQKLLGEVLALDTRPAYHEHDRRYWTRFRGFEVAWVRRASEVVICDIKFEES